MSTSILRNQLVAILAAIIALANSATLTNAGEGRRLEPARLGFLGATSAVTEKDRIGAFREGMRNLGYVEDKHIAIEWRYAHGKFDRLPELAGELVRLKVEAIVTTGSTSTRAASKATLSIPIIMTNENDPIGNGFVMSLARPGGNITGLSNLAPELSGKQLELLQEVVPKLRRIAVLGTSSSGGNALVRKEAELSSRALGLNIQYLDILAASDIHAAFREATERRADAVLALASPVLTSYRKQIADLALKSRLPAIYDRREFVEDGGLMTYGVNALELFRRAATYVDKILKGAKAAELPVEQPTKFELVINLKTAKQIGLTIPPNVLARADRVIR
jgi:putative tryptophan/tyrosine transport system substrate-binding protein